MVVAYTFGVSAEGSREGFLLGAMGNLRRRKRGVFPFFLTR